MHVRAVASLKQKYFLIFISDIDKGVIGAAGFLFVSNQTVGQVAQEDGRKEGKNVLRQASCVLWN